MTRTLTALALALALTACGGDGGQSASISPEPVPPTPVPTPTPTPTPPAVPDYAPAPAAKPTTGVSLPLGKCVNMGNHLEAPNEGDWGRAIVDGDFTIIHDAGFTSIRLPVRFSGHALAGAPYTIDAPFMARVRHVVDEAVAAHLAVVIDLHNYDELMSDPAGNAERFAGLWKQVAAEFSDEPASVFFELINEPRDRMTNANIQAIDAAALAQIRATNPTRPVVIGGESYSSVDSLATLPFPDDPYLVPTFHTYDPYDFTHQGATFIDNPPPVGRVFGSQADIDDLNNRLQKVKDFMARTGRVPFVGEYGAIDDTGIPTDQRVLYYKTISAAYASIGVQSCAWAYTNTFKLRDGNQWVPGMLDAISTTTTLP